MSNYQPDEYKSFQAFLEKACGIVLGDNKRYLVSSRLSRLMRDNNMDSLQQLVDQLNQASATRLRAQVVEAMTTNETLWFRDAYPFEVLTKIIYPEYKKDGKQNLRIWSAACSSGQEPYSISMATEEYISQNSGLKIEVVATDISQAILKDAKEARYDALALARGLSEERKRRFFSAIGNQWQVNANIRSRITFRESNLLQPYTSMGKFDLIFCRNVLIYFSINSKKDILNRMAECLNPRGFLLLGASESITQYSDAFEMVRASTGVVYRKKAY